MSITLATLGGSSPHYELCMTYNCTTMYSIASNSFTGCYTDVRSDRFSVFVNYLKQPVSMDTLNSMGWISYPSIVSLITNPVIEGKNAPRFEWNNISKSL